MEPVYLSLGSNMQDPRKQLSLAVKQIERRIGDVTRLSSLYLTAPWGNQKQEPFLNQVIEVETEMTPHRLLQELLMIETDMGRVRVQKWEPRMIDIDILFYGSVVMEGNLNIPHPLLHLRRFTLEPLHELIPDWKHPVLNLTVAEMLKNCPDIGKVEKLSD
ncbi:MAG: 2-amino-4-hydroxy-6-hydroxymethyldihydropteridine diphosphokinase [Bacteroidia bacterium]|jgi:2-amino-4-hydroxy-6-hydroxymethyldihydropteridine diphosphokinase